MMPVMLRIVTPLLLMKCWNQWRTELLRSLCLLVFLLAGANAAAEVIDRIDVRPHDIDADIVIRFTQKILYLRHSPLNDGKEVRIFLRLVDANVSESDLEQELVHSLKTDRVPDVTALYPELLNGMLVTFSQKTRFAVRPGTDGQSIIVTVPLLPAPAPEKKSVAIVPVVVPVAVVPAIPAAAIPVAAIPVVVVPEIAVKAAVPEVAALVSPEPAPDAAPVPTAADINLRAQGFYDQARAAMDSKDAATAVNRLNRVLGLPGNPVTEKAQALIGEAREMNGEIAKARAEYELYLKLYPNEANATRVRARLAALPKAGSPQRAAVRALPKEAGPAEWTYNGSVSSYYYKGNSQIETLTPPPPGQLAFNRDTLSLVDQNSLIDSVNLNVRRHDAYSDTRIVVRDTDNHNYLTPSRSYNRLYAAYVDYNDQKNGFYVRAGRQNPNGMGVLDRFDGVVGGYSFNPDWRVNSVFGEAVEYGSTFKKTFYGASVDMMPQASFPGVSVYVNEQTLEGLANRRAVGTEVKYFAGGASVFGMLDYDVLYRGVNIALMQGNYLSSSGDNYFFMLDHRKAPTLSLTNALMAFPGLSFSDLVKLQGVDQMRLQASALSATSDMFAIGVTHPLTEKWQLGVDYRLSEISSTQPVMAVLPLAVIGTCLGTIDPVNNNCIINTATQQGSGLNHVVTFQAIGTNLLFPNAVGLGNVSLIKAPTYKGESSSLGYAFPLFGQARLDSNLHYYSQKDDSDNKQDRLSFSSRLSYQWNSGFYLEGEVGRENANSSGALRNDHSTRNYFYMGLRGDVH